MGIQFSTMLLKELTGLSVITYLLKTFQFYL